MAEETWKNYKEKKNFKPSPLRGIRVLEVATLVFGPAGPTFLAKMGAEVIKCEIPPMGDNTRNMRPFGYLFKGATSPESIGNNANNNHTCNKRYKFLYGHKSP